MNSNNNQFIKYLIVLICCFSILLKVESQTPTPTSTTTPSPYKPILLMHGFALSNSCGSYHDWDTYMKFIQQYNPNQLAIPLNIDNHFKSTKAMFTQINDIYLLIESIIDSNPTAFENGFHIIAHSQGALSMRSILEMYGLKVDNFVSLAGVHNGIYGVGFTNDYWFGNFTDYELTELLYTPTMQKQFSVANWWKDPKNNDKYLTDNFFLPSINQELSVSTPEFKSNFLSSINGEFNAFASKDDGVVVPWVSELFGYYNENMVMVQMNETDSYQNDSYGLKTLDLNGKLKLTHVDGVKHAEWLSREDLFTQYVLPLISK